METETTETVETEQTDAETVEVTDEVDAQDEVEDPAAGLKSALQKERNGHKSAAKRVKELELELADRDKSPDEKALDAARREGESAGAAKYRQQIVAVEFRAAAKERGIAPQTALKLADLADVEVGDDGEVDSDSLISALDAVIADHPTLVPARFQGTADQGGRGRDAAPKQLTEEALKTMTAEQISEARAAGRLDKLLGVAK